MVISIELKKGHMTPKFSFFDSPPPTAFRIFINIYKRGFHSRTLVPAIPIKLLTSVTRKSEWQAHHFSPSIEVARIFQVGNCF